MTGHAEIFGAELSSHTKYVFEGGKKLAIYTWYFKIYKGMAVHLKYIQKLFQLSKKNNTSQCWKVESDQKLFNPLLKYANIHYELNLIRQECNRLDKPGPKVFQFN